MPGFRRTIAFPLRCIPTSLRDLVKKLVLVVVVVAAIGAFGAPKVLERLNAGRSQRTVKDIRNTGTAMFSWLTDQVGVAPEEQSTPRALVTLARFDGTSHVVPTSAFRYAGALAAQPESATVNVGDYKQISFDDLKKKLVPQYIQEVPSKDGWGHPYEYFVSDSLLSRAVLLIRSPGKDGVYEGASYRVGTFDVKSFNDDIVWADGFFVRAPK